ncbi:TonB-dependent receptor [uncultured Draconibacterium sp.]|uniref:SusC/RagA family TonB-linked outer membrane protein n=1 Tax=uncultured Draconibacterium sp. TaxID=1573823 RepID=UPI0029C73932|nr:TonB-dependent receptor [uncultured Draconibacterium sp.]
MQNIKSYSLQYLWHVSNLSIGTNNWPRRLFIICFTFLLCINQLQAQTITVTGRVTDQNDQPLPGVNVVIKETPSTGTITKDDGLYLLKEVPSDAVLFFSFIGFKTLEIPLNGRSHLNVQLQEDITTLTEVTVNAGYYTVKDQERTGSIARVRSKELENQPVSNALSSVQGRMAGVNITQSSGVPGGGYNIQIRGTNSLRRDGNYPLYIIDGVPATLQSPSALGGTIIPYGEIDPLNAINPNDIESIEILKDADATAIYGSRGANGVILVTTKKGKTGSRTALSINSSYGVSQIARKMKLMDTPQYLEMRRQAYANDGITDYPANAYDINGTWDDTRYTDWQEELIGNTATNSMLQFSLNGGGNNSRFLISGSHNEQTTVFSDDFKYKTDNISGNFSHHSSDKRFMLNASGLFSNQSNNLIQTEITSQALRLSPSAPALYQEDGSLNWENNTFNNPLAAYESTYSYKSKTFNSDLNLQYEVLPSLFIKANGGISYTSFEEIMLRPNTMYNPAYGLTPDFSQAFKNLNQNFSWIVEPQLNYRHTFNNHNLDVLVGGTLQQTQRTTLNIMGYGFESNALITNLAAAANVMVTGDDKTEYRYAALFGRINYKYKERYILNFTGRRDGSSRFGPDQRFASFGAIGGAWIFSKEYFLASSSWLSFGKLRASYGITGSDLIGDYQFLDTYTVSNTLYGGNTSLYPSRLNNPYFSWEKTTKLEAAIELGFLKDRIQFSTAWYRNRSGNQLVGIPLPGTTGFSTIQANLPAKVENKGLEFELSTTPVQSEHFTWNSSFNISFPDNKLISFPGLEGSTYANQYVIGYPTSIIKGYNYEGIDPETGLYQFTDYNDDGNITSPDDNQVIEDIAVKYFGGWSNQISYRQWEFSFLFQFVNQRQKNYISMMPRPGSMYNQPVEVLDVWSEENPDGQYMPYSSGTNSQINRLHGYLSNSNAAVSDASFIRLKNIQLAYQLQVNKYLQSARFYVQGQNLLTISDYFGLDPEFSLSGYLPPLKTWSFGIQLNF